MSSSSSEARPRKRKESRETSAERMIIMPMTVWRRYGKRYAFSAFRSFEQPQAVFLEGGEITAGGRVPAVRAVAGPELLGDFLVAVRNFQRRVSAHITQVKAG